MFNSDLFAKNDAYIKLAFTHLNPFKAMKESEDFKDDNFITIMNNYLLDVSELLKEYERNVSNIKVLSYKETLIDDVYHSNKSFSFINLQEINTVFVLGKLYKYLKETEDFNFTELLEEKNEDYEIHTIETLSDKLNILKDRVIEPCEVVASEYYGKVKRYNEGEELVGVIVNCREVLKTTKERLLKIIEKTQKFIQVLAGRFASYPDRQKTDVVYACVYLNINISLQIQAIINTIKELTCATDIYNSRLLMVERGVDN